MPTGERTIIVNAPPAHVFDVIVDYERYPEFTRDVIAARIDQTAGDERVVTFTTRVVKKLTYTVRLRHDRPHRVEWSLVEATLLKRNDGHWVLEPLSGQRTEVSYRCDLAVGTLVPKAVSTKMIAVSLPSMLRDFKARAEATYRRTEEK